MSSTTHVSPPHPTPSSLAPPPPSPPRRQCCQVTPSSQLQPLLRAWQDFHRQACECLRGGTRPLVAQLPSRAHGEAAVRALGALEAAVERGVAMAEVQGMPVDAMVDHCYDALALVRGA